MYITHMSMPVQSWLIHAFSTASFNQGVTLTSQVTCARGARRLLWCHQLL